MCRVASAFIRDAAGLAYIDDQGRLFPLLEVDEDDEEPVLFESEQIWFSKEPGRALCHCFAGRFDSAAFCAFGGRGRRFGRRLYPLPAGGGGRRQRQPPAFRLSSAGRSAAIRHRRQRSGVLAELRQCGGRAISLRRQQRVDQTGVC